MRSSILSGLLLLCFYIPINSIASPVDTLIIDGKKVLINRVVEYDTVSVKEYRDPSEIAKPKKGIDWLLGLEAGTLLAFSSIQSDLNNLESVDEFVDSPYGFSVGPNVLFYCGFPLGNSWSVYSGVGFSTVRMPFQTFGINQLEDSLHQFASFEKGELSQITRYDFGDLGAELDTIDVSLSKEEIDLQYLEIPLLFQYSRSLPKKPRWKIDLEFGVNVLLLVDKSTAELIVINEEGEFEEVPTAGQQYTPTLFGIHAAGGFSRRISKNLSIHGRVLLKMPLNSPTKPVSRIQTDFYQGGLQFGISYIFRN